jgi:hypothetical protein
MFLNLGSHLSYFSFTDDRVMQAERRDAVEERRSRSTAACTPQSLPVYRGACRRNSKAMTVSPRAARPSARVA